MSSFFFLVYSGLLLRTYAQDLRTGIRTMPPLRRRARVQVTNVGAEAALLNGYSVQQLRNVCRQKKITSTGNKATLLNRLRGSGPRVMVSNADARGRLQETNEMFGPVSVLPQTMWSTPTRTIPPSRKDN